MDAVAIRERTQAVPNGYVEELHPDADPHMTRAAREARTAWRLEHLAEWHRGLETLFYFDPEYAYDVVHEYEDEWTTDPDHSGDGVKFYEFNEGGVLEPTDDRRTLLEGVLLILLRTVLGNRAESQGRLYFAGDLAERLKLLTRGGNPGSYVKPDLMVFPPAYALPAGVRRERRDCALRTHEGEPPPELVVEVLSVSSVARDYGVKARLYEALGVAEYWVCDVGGMRRPGSPVELSVFRPGADGRYAPVPPSRLPVGAGDRWEVPVYGGGALGRPFRLRPGAYEPRFQWWDGAQGRWRDPESDAAHERQVERDRHARERQADRERHAHGSCRRPGWKAGQRAGQRAGRRNGWRWPWPRCTLPVRAPACPGPGPDRGALAPGRAAAGRDGPPSASAAGAGRVAVPAADPGWERRCRFPVKPWLCPQV